MHHFCIQNDPFALNKDAFGQNHINNFHAPLTPFIVKKFLKILRADPEVWECVIFRTKMAHWSKQDFSSEKATTYSSSIYCLPSLCKIWSKSLKRLLRKLTICKYVMCTFCFLFSEKLPFLAFILRRRMNA